MSAKTTAGFLFMALWATVGPVRADAALPEAALADSVRKYKFLAKTARDKQDNPAALTYYRQLVRYQPDYQRGHFYIGQILSEMGQLEAAKVAFLASAALDTLHRNTHLGLYQIYLAEADPDSAWWALERAVRQDGPAAEGVFGFAAADKPYYNDYRRKVADLYRRQGQTAQALRHYEDLVGGVENARLADRDLIELIVALHRELGEVEPALRWQQRLIALEGGEGEAVSPEGQRVALAAMVDLMVESGDVPAAIRTLPRLAEIDTAGRYAHFHRLEQLAEDIGDRASRLEGLRGMAQANPRDVESLVTLVELYLGDGDQTRASRWLDAGLKTNPEDPQLHLLQGDLFVLQGNEEKALEAFGVAMADPGWHDVAQQRIWQIRPPETEEERLKRAFFGGPKSAAGDE
ncbi:MAG: tetratricopeptide repeat protein [Gemmatimonadota bacterium]